MANNILLLHILTENIGNMQTEVILAKWFRYSYKYSELTRTIVSYLIYLTAHPPTKGRGMAWH